MKIKEFAQQTNLSAKTIRYYEEIGLWPMPPRLENGYRDYDEADVARARLVAGARRLDFSLIAGSRAGHGCRCVCLSIYLYQHRRAHIADHCWPAPYQLWPVANTGAVTSFWLANPVVTTAVAHTISLTAPKNNVGV